MYLQGGHNNPIVWLGEQWLIAPSDRRRRGPFDLAAVLPVYGNVVSPLFSNPSVAKISAWPTPSNGSPSMIVARRRRGREKVASVLTKDHTLHHLKPPKGFKTRARCRIR